MPWTPAQHRYFCAIAHGMKPKSKSAPSKAQAKKMCREGVKGKRKIVRRGKR